MRTLALYNVKGGVGKTASAVNLAHLSTLDGARTLLWDLDPQGAASFYLRVETTRGDGGEEGDGDGGEARGALAGGKVEKKKRLRRRVGATDFAGLDLVPARLAYRHLDLALAESERPGRRLRDLVQAIGGYDHVFLDCPPSLSLTSESVFQAADVLLVPTVPTPLSLRTLEQLAGRLALLEKAPRVLPFFCMVDRRKGLHREIVARGTADFAALATAIPYAAEVERMGVERRPLSLFAPRSAAARAYAELWREIGERLAGA